MSSSMPGPARYGVPRGARWRRPSGPPWRQDAPGLLVAGQVEVGVDAGDAPLERAAEGRVVVQAPVAADVELAPCSSVMPGKAPRRAVDLGPLQRQLVPAHAAHGQVLRVVGQGQVLVAPPGGAGHDLLERALAVAGERRVHVEVATQVLEREPRGQLARLGSLDLAAVLAHGGRDERQVERPVDRLLGLGCDHVAGLGVAQAVLVQEPAPGQGALPELDVVRLGAGEVLAGGAELARLDDPQVDLQPGRGEHRGLGLAAAQDVAHGRQLQEASRTAGRLARRRHDVDVRHRLSQATQAAAVAGALDRGKRLERLHQLARDRHRLGDGPALVLSGSPCAPWPRAASPRASRRGPRCPGPSGLRGQPASPPGCRRPARSAAAAASWGRAPEACRAPRNPAGTSGAAPRASRSCRSRRTRGSSWPCSGRCRRWP